MKLSEIKSISNWAWLISSSQGVYLNTAGGRLGLKSAPNDLSIGHFFIGLNFELLREHESAWILPFDDKLEWGQRVFPYNAFLTCRNESTR